MAWNLAEFSKIEKDDLRGSIIDQFLMDSDILQIIPWETTGKLSMRVLRYKDLPSWGYRLVNEGLSESTGKLADKVESLCLGGLYIDTDKAIARASNTIADARAIQQTMAMKAAAYQFNWKFIAGNPTTDPKEFKGITKRIDDIYAEGYTDQKIACNSTSVGILNSQTTRFNFIEDVEKLQYAVAGKAADMLLMNKKMLLALRSCLLREKLLSYDKDMFDRRIDMWGSTRLVDIGVRADQTTEIILNTETAAGVTSGGTECTSIYAVKFGIGDMLWGLQEYPMETEDLGLLQTKPVYRTQVDWNHGLADVNPRCMARMYGIVPDSSS
jgi:hypothetical protein